MVHLYERRIGPHVSKFQQARISGAAECRPGIGPVTTKLCEVASPTRNSLIGENDAYLDRQSGKSYWHSEFGDNDEKSPDDIGDEVLDFAREFLPDDYDKVRHIFSRRGAYRRYKDLLARRASSNGGTISRTNPRRRLCGSGARRTGSISAEPGVSSCMSPAVQSGRI